LNALNILLEYIEKYIGDVVGFRVEICIFIYFLTQGSLENIGWTLGDVGKAPNFFFLLGNEKYQKGRQGC
jgi:hypothetical protein